MSLVQSYLQEFDRFFSPDSTEESGPTWHDRLALAGIKGELRNSRFRSVCWRVFLGVLPKNREQWLLATQQSRLDYEQKRKQVLENSTAQNSKFMPGDAAAEALQNGAGSGASPWNRTMDDDQELRQTIDQDVVRTHPRVQFFNLPQIQHLMSDILFVFAKLNPHLQYRQGMHELLAPLVFVLRADLNAFEHVRGESDYLDSDFNQEIVQLVDGDYFEHDAYAMFCRVMRVVEPWYSSAQLMTGPRFPESNSQQPIEESQSATPSSTNPFAIDSTTQPADDATEQPQQSDSTGDSESVRRLQKAQAKRKQSQPNAAEKEILARLQHIHSGLLKDIDPTLYQHLERLDVAPQLYGIRWVRLLFGREFTIQDLLVLWDALFGHDSELVLVDYIFVAMLVYVRDLLLHGDFSACLHVVMRYPPTADVQYLVASALYLSNPARFPRPPPCQALPVMIQNNAMVGHGRNGSPMTTPHSNLSPSSTFAGEILDSAGSFLTKGFNSIQRKIEDVAGLDQSPSHNSRLSERSQGSSTHGMSQSNSNSSLRLTRFLPDALISTAKTPTSSAAKFVDKFLSLGNDELPQRSPGASPRPGSQPRRVLPQPPRRPDPPKSLPQGGNNNARSGLDQSVLMNVCNRALSDLNAALADLDMLRPVLTEPRHAQVAADIAQRVTAARNSLQVISGRPLVASSSSSSRSSTPSATTPN